MRVAITRVRIMHSQTRSHHMRRRIRTMIRIVTTTPKANARSDRMTIRPRYHALYLRAFAENHTSPKSQDIHESTQKSQSSAHTLPVDAAALNQYAAHSNQSKAQQTTSSDRSKCTTTSLPARSLPGTGVKLTSCGLGKVVR